MTESVRKRWGRDRDAHMDVALYDDALTTRLYISNKKEF